MAGPRNPKFMIGEIDGIEQDGLVEYEPQAEDIAYDNTTSGIPATDAQNAIDQLNTNVTGTSSPGFVFGRSGNTNSGTWLSNEGTPSNTVGIPILLNSPTLKAIIATNETNTATFTVEIYEHDGTTFTLIDSLTVTSARKEKKILGSPAVLTSEKELAVLVSAGSAKNIKVVCLLGGSTIV